MIVAFFAWEQAVERRGGQPLLDLALFHSAAFTWGVILFTVLTLALVGLLFTMPQYFGGIAAARTLQSATLLATVRAAFVHGMDIALIVSAGFAAAGIVLALMFMPGRPGPGAGTRPDPREGDRVAAQA